MESKDTVKLYIHIVSPVHIGGGQEKCWINGIHYIYEQDDKIVRVFSQEKLEKYLTNEEIIRLTNAIELGKAQEFFEYLVNTRKIPFSDFSKDYFMPYRPEGDIKTMIRTGLGEPYLPGSSVKGAIRSAMFSFAYHKNPSIKNQIDRLNQLPTLRGQGNKMNQALFGKIENNLMRFIQVSDAMFKNTMLFNAKVFNLFEDRYLRDWFGGWKHSQDKGTDERFKPTGFSSTYETLEINDWSTFRIKVNRTLWDLMDKINQVQRPRYWNILMNGNPIEKLFGMINFATRKYILSEMEFFEAFPAENSDHIINELNEILATMPKDNRSCVLKMGAGTGFHAITGNWQFQDFADTGMHGGGRLRGKKKFKSRKISFSKFEGDEGYETLFFPMGFVKIYTQDAWDEV